MNHIPSDIHTFPSIIEYRASQTPHKTAFTFLKGGKEEEKLTFREVFLSARRVAGIINRYAKPGDRVLINDHPGLNYIKSFFGCLLSGVIAVPVYPPRFNQKLERLHGIISNCSPTLAISGKSVRDDIQTRFKSDPYLTKLHWITDLEEESRFLPRPYSSDDVALLQYTSGSTSLPKGVMITHKNIMANLEAITHLMEVTSEDINVSWLPPYHDMGLIGSILETFYAGAHSVLMSPFSFIQRPLRWPLAIDKYKATITGGPSFAFHLLTERIDQKQMEGMDLSSLSLIYCGAEPVRKPVLDRFADHFSPCKIDKKALVACYGLAEATLIVSSSPRKTPLSSLKVQTNNFEVHRKAVASENNTQSKSLVSCGRIPPEHEVKIIDPDTCEERPEGEVGEIWFRGPSVALGYWKEQSSLSFHGKACGKTYMRTGDFGLIHKNELYVTGRIKDVMILKGRNLYPQDIEQTVTSGHNALRSTSCAAFSIEDEGEEKLVVVQEIDRHQGRDIPYHEIFSAIKEKVVESHGITPHAISLVKTNSIPVTSSGKIQRHLSKKYYQNNELSELRRMEAT